MGRLSLVLAACRTRSTPSRRMANGQVPQTLQFIRAFSQAPQARSGATLRFMRGRQARTSDWRVLSDQAPTLSLSAQRGRRGAGGEGQVEKQVVLNERERTVNTSAQENACSLQDHECDSPQRTLNANMRNGKSRSSNHSSGAKLARIGLTFASKLQRSNWLNTERLSAGMLHK